MEQRAQSVVARVARNEPQRKLLVVVLASLAFALGVLGQRQFVNEVNVTGGLLFWAGAISAFLAALWVAHSLLGSAGEQPYEASERPLPLRVEAGLFAVVLAIGIFFRFYRIEDIPPGLNNDAAFNGLFALNITPVIDYVAHPFVSIGWGRETLFHQLIAVNQSFLGTTDFAIQLAGITIGIATLAAFYILMRRLFDAQLALVAMFLMGVSGWHVTFSRVGWRSILVPLFAALIFYCLVRAVHERRVLYLVLAGLLLGISQHSYNGAQLLPFIVVAYLAYEVLHSRQLLKTNLSRLGVIAAAALVTFAPLGWYALNNWSLYTSRSRSLWIGEQIENMGSLEPLFTNIKNALLLFNFRANGNDFFVWEPLLDIPVAIFFPLGLILAASRFKQRNYFLLLVTLALTLVVAVLSRPDGNRTLLTVIPVTAFAALFLVEAWRWLRWAFPRYTALMTVVRVAVLLYTAYDTYDSYLGPNRREQFGFTPEATRVGRYVDGISGDYQVIILAGRWPLAPLDYFTYQESGSVYRMQPVAELPDIRPSPGQSTAFFVEYSWQGLITRHQFEPALNQEVITGLQEAYPDADIDLIYYPDDSDTGAAYVFLFPEGAPISETPVQLEGAAGRDGQRRDDLLEIRSALEEYESEAGAFPATGGQVQAGCIHDGIDALCVIEPLLGDKLLDPRGDGQHGYWYWSDGSSFTLYAVFEQPLRIEEQCLAPGEPAFAGRDDIYCIRGG